MPKSDDKNDKVFDIAKPGKTAASASSRPVIVGHKTLLQDPMVTNMPSAPILKKVKIDQNDEGVDETVSGDPAGDIKLLDSSDKTIEPSDTESIADEQPEAEPLEESDEPENEQKPVEPAVKDKPDEAEEVPEPDVSNETEKEPDEEKNEDEAEATDKSDASQDTDSDKAADKPTESKKDKDKQVDDSAKVAQEAAYQKLIDDKTYFVPIGEQKRKRSMRRFLLIIILLLLLAIMAGDLLIDNGTIKTNIKPPIRILNKNTQSGS
jgi:hypothetical protein